MPNDPVARIEEIEKLLFALPGEPMLGSELDGFLAGVLVCPTLIMPGEWLPKDDHGYLRSVYAHADSIGVGVGGPDLIPVRREFRAHSYPLIAARRRDRVCAGLAVQDNNLAAVDKLTKLPVTVPMLAAFAADSLHLDYVFWGLQEPYYSRDVLPWLRTQPATPPPH